MEQGSRGSTCAGVQCAGMELVHEPVLFELRSVCLGVRLKLGWLKPYSVIQGLDA